MRNESHYINSHYTHSLCEYLDGCEKREKFSVLCVKNPTKKYRILCTTNIFGMIWIVRHIASKEYNVETEYYKIFPSFGYFCFFFRSMYCPNCTKYMQRREVSIKFKLFVVFFFCENRAFHRHQCTSVMVLQNLYGYRKMCTKYF